MAKLTRTSNLAMRSLRSCIAGVYPAASWMIEFWINGKYKKWLVAVT